MNKTETYINSLIPKNISGKKRKLLYSELQNHIYEKVDYYIELGYSKEDSENKAIEDFGTDENIIKSINREFESLYHERTWWSVAVAIIISVMNLMCFWLDAWIYSADWNDLPESDDVLISFAMIFAVIFAVAFARAKKYRKMLIGIGVANIGVAFSVLLAFYPQTAICIGREYFIFARIMHTALSRQNSRERYSVLHCVCISYRCQCILLCNFGSYKKVNSERYRKTKKENRGFRLCFCGFYYRQYGALSDKRKLLEEL